MKKSQLFIAIAMIAAGGVTAVSCSQDDEVMGPEVSSEGQPIRFAANTEFSRAGDITTNTLTSFNVYAYTCTKPSPTLFMENVEVKKTGTNLWTYSPVKYWPANESVNFYAFAPASWVDSISPLNPIPYESYPGTEDIVYATCPDMTSHPGVVSAQVTFNFRHALSKVSIKMSSTDSTITVKVNNVLLVNIASKGNFHFPAQSTAEKASEETVGNWTDQNSPAFYIYHMSQTPDDIITLTTTPTAIGQPEWGGSAKFLIPQLLSFRSGGTGSDTYLTIQGAIYDAKTGDKLWPNANTPPENLVPGSSFGDGLLRFPLNTSKFSQWQPGVHYTYQIVINSHEEMGPIEFGNPTVESFVEVATTYQ